MYYLLSKKFAFKRWHVRDNIDLNIFVSITLIRTKLSSYIDPLIRGKKKNYLYMGTQKHCRIPYDTYDT